MGRLPRADEANGIYHMLNRGNRRAPIFHKPEDYEAFERILVEALDRSQIKLFAYCLLPNHWHMVVSPEVDGEMGRFGQWLGLTHTQRHHAHYQSAGDGHLYQGRFKSFPVQSDEHYLAVCRYVERNAYMAGLCDRPDEWRFGSLWRWAHGTPADKSLLSTWPIPRRPNWIDFVAAPLTDKERKAMKQSIEKGVPFGDESWVTETVRRYGLESALRGRGRPRKLPRLP